MAEADLEAIGQYRISRAAEQQLKQRCRDTGHKVSSYVRILIYRDLGIMPPGTP